MRIRQPYIKFNELARDLSVSVIIGLGLAGRLWQLFYGILTRLSQFRPDKPGNAAFAQARISEFALFSTSLTELTRQRKHPFPLQKQFTDSASHELQTPLAIASARLDFLRQSQQLTQAAHTHLNGLPITFQYDVEHREHSFQIK